MTQTTEDPTIMNKNRINKLVKKAFGFGVRGDIGRFGSIGGSLASHFPSYMKVNELSLIVDRWIFGDIVSLLFGVGYEIGKFNSQDGSDLTVKKQHIPQAERYAELYRYETGREINISTY